MDGASAAVLASCGGERRTRGCDDNRRVGYRRAIWRSVYSVDLTTMRRWSAVRRGILVPVTMVVGGLLTDPEIGTLAGMSALFVGLQERNASASYTSRVMVVQSFFFAAVVFVGGALAHLWATPIVLALTAVAAGLAAYNDRAMSRMFGDVMPVAAFLGLSAVETRTAAVMAVAVLFGGLAQALLARVSVRIEEDIMERRPVAAALVAVADHLDDALPRRSTSTGRAAEERITQRSRPSTPPIWPRSAAGTSGRWSPTPSCCARRRPRSGCVGRSTCRWGRRTRWATRWPMPPGRCAVWPPR